MGAYVPPDLRQPLYDAGALGEVNVLRVGVPRAQRFGQPGAVDGAREDQGAGGLHVRDLTLPERRVRRQGEEMRNVLPQPVEEVDDLLATPDGVMHVQREGVVAPDQPPQLRLQALVVRLVYDLLLTPVSDGVRPAGAQITAQTLGVPQQDPPARHQIPRHAARVGVYARVGLYLAIYELA